MRLATVTGLLLCVMGLGPAVRGAPRLADQDATPDSTVYLLAPASVLQVHAGKSGILAGLGHEHLVRAHAFTGEIVYFPAALARSRVSVTVLTDSLRVVPQADAANISKITESMRRKTLEVDSFPKITFVSQTVGVGPAAAGSGGQERAGAAPTADMPGPPSARVLVTGDLTMVGKTRPVSVDMDLTVAGDTLRADGSFVVKQTDFGIKPYGTALGMVKVKDAVRFELHVVAIAVAPAAPAPPAEPRDTSFAPQR